MVILRISELLINPPPLRPAFSWKTWTTSPPSRRGPQKRRLRSAPLGASGCLTFWVWLKIDPEGQVAQVLVHVSTYRSGKPWWTSGFSSHSRRQTVCSDLPGKDAPPGAEIARTWTPAGSHFLASWLLSCWLPFFLAFFLFGFLSCWQKKRRPPCFERPGVERTVLMFFVREPKGKLC